MKGRHARPRRRPPLTLVAGAVILCVAFALVRYGPTHSTSASSAAPTTSTSTSSEVAPEGDASTSSSDPFRTLPELSDPGCARLAVTGGQACAVRARRRVDLVVETTSGRQLRKQLAPTTPDDRLKVVAQQMIDGSNGPSIR